MILILTCFLFSKQKIPILTQNPTIRVSYAPKVEVKNLKGEIPSVFPKDFFQEKDIQILESYEIEIEGGKQYILKYLSLQLPSQIFKIYYEYLTKKEWIIFKENLLNTTQTSKISAVKKSEGFIYTLNIYSILNTNRKNIVEINLIQKNEK